MFEMQKQGKLARFVCTHHVATWLSNVTVGWFPDSLGVDSNRRRVCFIVN